MMWVRPSRSRVKYSGPMLFATSGLEEWQNQKQPPAAVFPPARLWQSRQKSILFATGVAMALPGLSLRSFSPAIVLAPCTEWQLTQPLYGAKS
jgi:hypothetical protein